LSTSGSSSSTAGGELCQANGLAIGIGAVELVDSDPGVARIFVGDKGGTLGAVVAVVEETGGENRSDAVEEFLIRD
jgi:hypothetical protein